MYKIDKSQIGEIMTKEKDFKNDCCASSLLVGLNDQRETTTLCDFTIKVNTESFPVHRCVLLASCEYFKAVLLGEFLEKNKCEIEMKEMCPESMKTILNYMYTGVLTINLNNVWEVLQSANLLQLIWVKDKCAEYIEMILNDGNCLEIFKFASLFNCHQLEYESKKVVLKNLEEIMKTQSFLELSNENIEKLLDSDNISIFEDTNLLALLHWVKHDLTDRKKQLGLLLNSVNHKYISKDFFKTSILNEPTLLDDISCSKWLVKNFNFTATNVLNYGRNLFICDANTQRQCHYYDIVNSECHAITERPDSKRFYPVKYQNCIYLTGGCRRTNIALNAFTELYLRKFHVYDIMEDSWKDIDFDINREYHTANVLNDSLYIIGGYYQTALKEVKKYDFQTLQLASQSFMNSRRYSHGVAIKDQRIYVCGGEDDIKSAESFDPREGKWINLPCMLDANGPGSLVSIGNDLYFASKNKNGTELFDTRRNCWNSIGDAPGSTLVNVCDHLYCVAKEGIYRYEENRWYSVHQENFSTSFAFPLNF